MTGIERLYSRGAMLYGGDYNPEQWPEEVWAEDMRLLKEAHINEVTLNVFSWAQLQPSEDVYDFSKLDRIVKTVTDAGMSIVMATSTGALPAWMSLRHPDVNRVDISGRTFRHRERHNACINSPTFRKYAVALAGRLAQRYAGLDNLVAWHVGNEYGGFCWCDNCAKAFREWLRAEYGSIEALNEAWNSAFWSHTYYSFDEIFPPSKLGDLTGNRADKGVLPAANLDYRRFYGECVLDSFNEEKAAIREYDRTNPVTTNMMGTFPHYDYFTWRNSLDVVSWDAYPRPDAEPAWPAFCHELMRGVGGGAPFMLMEQTPNRQNWMEYNTQKRPGQMRELSWQAVAHGADTVQFFQLRQNRSGCEKFHGAVIGSDGTDRTRTFRECRELGAELDRVSGRFLGSRVEPARVALVYDWQSRWGIEFSAGPTISLDYSAEVLRWYRELHRRNIPVEVVGPYDDYSHYDVVLAPCLYMADDPLIARLRSFVKGGGRLLLTSLSLLTDRHDSLYQGEIPVPLRDLAGVWVEETDAMDPKQTVVPLRFAGADAGSDAGSAGAGAGAPHGRVLFDVLEADEGTQVLATYGSQYYAGTPAFTFRPFAGGSGSSDGGSGAGGVFYAATFPDEVALPLMVDALLEGTDVTGTSLPGRLELTRRVASDGTVFTFVINPDDREVPGVWLPVAGRDLLGGADVSPDAPVDVPPFGVLIIES